MTADYSEATREIISDIYAKPDIVVSLTEQLGSRFSAICALTETVAPNLVVPNEIDRKGRIAQALTDWHGQLLEQCSELFKQLTEPQPLGLGLTREEANLSEDLQTLQAVRRGVRAARRNYNRFAYGSSRRYN